jgi:hypothetical protein
VAADLPGGHESGGAGFLVVGELDVGQATS